MNQKTGLVLLLFVVVALFGGFVVYDVVKNNRLVQLKQIQGQTNWKWEDQWNHNGQPLQQPQPQQPIQPQQPQTQRQIVASNYNDAIEQSGKLGMPVMVYFEADWCGWCKKMKSETLQSASVQEVMKNYILVHVDADTNGQVVRKFGVTGLPSYVITNVNEQNLKKGAGYKDARSFSQWLNNPNLYRQPKREDRSPRIRQG